MHSLRQWARLSYDTSAAITAFPQSVDDVFTGPDSNRINDVRQWGISGDRTVINIEQPDELQQDWQVFTRRLRQHRSAQNSDGAFGSGKVEESWRHGPVPSRARFRTTINREASKCRHDVVRMSGCTSTEPGQRRVLRYTLNFAASLLVRCTLKDGILKVCGRCMTAAAPLCPPSRWTEQLPNVQNHNLSKIGSPMFVMFLSVRQFAFLNNDEIVVKPCPFKRWVNISQFVCVFRPSARCLCFSIHV